jgi:hypothetical protein
LFTLAPRTSTGSDRRCNPTAAHPRTADERRFPERPGMQRYHGFDPETGRVPQLEICFHTAPRARSAHAGIGLE